MTMRRTVHLENLLPNTAWRLYSEFVNLSMDVHLVTAEEAEDTYEMVEGELVGTDTLFGKGFRVIETGVDVSPDGVDLHRVQVDGKSLYITCNRFTIRMG